jgi:hypothetical protein
MKNQGLGRHSDKMWIVNATENTPQTQDPDSTNLPKRIGICWKKAFTECSQSVVCCKRLYFCNLRIETKKKSWLHYNALFRFLAANLRKEKKKSL